MPNTHGGARPGAGRNPGPKFPFDIVKVPTGVDRVIVTDPIENLLVRAAVKQIFRIPVGFHLWLEARVNEDSPIGDLARDCQGIEFESIQQLRDILCPDGYHESVDECATAALAAASRTLELAASEYLAVNPANALESRDVE